MSKLLLSAALCLHWFNPLVWVMYVLANRDLELSCDEMVLRLLGIENRSAYAMALLEMEEKRSGFGALYSAFGKNAIEERIGAIMKMKKRSLLSVVMAVVLVFTLTACHLAGGGGDERAGSRGKGYYRKRNRIGDKRAYRKREKSNWLGV